MIAGIDVVGVDSGGNVADGRISWQTAAADIGSHAVEVDVADPFGATVTLSFSLSVTADNVNPTGSIRVSAEPAKLGESLTVIVLAADNVAVDAVTLTLGGTPVVLDANHSATISVSSLTTLAFSATVTDSSGNSTTVTKNVTVIDPSDVNAPVVSLANPANNATISEPLDVRVVVTLPDGTTQGFTFYGAPATSLGSIIADYQPRFVAACR